MTYCFNGKSDSGIEMLWSVGIFFNGCLNLFFFGCWLALSCLVQLPQFDLDLRHWLGPNVLEAINADRIIKLRGRDLVGHSSGFFYTMNLLQLMLHQDP